MSVPNPSTTTITTTAHSESSHPKYLTPSPLGTKEYWSTLYTTDLTTRSQTHPAHTGTSWFDDANAERKTIRYLASLLPPRQIPPQTTPPKPPAPTPAAGVRIRRTYLSRTSTSFLDLGTGNGSLLFALRADGWDGRMVGMDYAEEGLELAQVVWAEITASEGLSSSLDEDKDGDGDGDGDSEGASASRRPIDFRILDILSLADLGVELPLWTTGPAGSDDGGVGGFDVVLDKGTFDAISLSDTTDPRTGKRGVEVYADAAKRFMKRPGGRMVVTSCNWTEGELEGWFCGGNDDDDDGTGVGRLEVVGRIPYRKFRFGGSEGSVVVGLVFGWKGV